MRTKVKTLTAQLPPTPCTEEMRKEVLSVAVLQGKSIAEIQRQALSFFLGSLDSRAIEIDSITSKENLS